MFGLVKLPNTQEKLGSERQPSNYRFHRIVDFFCFLKRLLVDEQTTRWSHDLNFVIQKRPTSGLIWRAYFSTTLSSYRDLI